MARINSNKAIEALTMAGRYRIDDGLYLMVSKTGRRSWVLRYQRDGRRHDAGLGAYPSVTLTDARQMALDARRSLAMGLDPIHQRRLAQQAGLAIPTFSDIAAKVLETVARDALNEKSLFRARLLLGPKYCKSLLDRPVNSITSADLAKILNGVAATRRETARKLHGVLSKVFEAARVTLRDVHGIELGNQPTNLRDLRALGYDRRVINKNYPALDWRDAPEFMTALRGRTGTAYRALELTILTGVREGAVAGAKWEEFDLDAGIWTVPLSRLKDRRHREKPLRVPLSSRVLETLKAVEGLDSTWVFPGLRPKRPIVAQSMLQALKLKLNRDASGQPIWLDPESRRPIVVHGFRATLKTFADDRGIRREVSELTLGHSFGGDVERRYRRTDLLDDRRRFLQAWSDHCNQSVSANVVALRR